MPEESAFARLKARIARLRSWAVPAAGLVVAAWFVASDITFLPSALKLTIPHMPDGLLSGVAFALLILVAPTIPLRSAAGDRARSVTFALAAIAGSAVVVALPPSLDRRRHVLHGGLAHIAPWVRIPLAAIVLLLLGKLFLLRRYTAIAELRPDPRRATAPLLPNQARDLERLKDAVCIPAARDGAQVLQLRGRWGDGKSFLLDQLATRLPDHAVVRIDVWRYEGEPDLHLALADEVLGHERHLLPYGWLRYPLLMPVWKYVGRAADEIKLRLSSKTVAESSLEVPIRVPLLPWQGPLERLLERSYRRGRKTVIVLDEIDRAGPAVVQAALTLTRRAFDRRGVTIVLAYVDELIAYKAFNPLLPMIADLESTVHAVVYNMLFGGSGRFAFPGTPAPQSLATAWTAVAEGEGTDLVPVIRRWFAGLDHHQRSYLQLLFSEKYLGPGRIEITPVDSTDIAQMVVETFPILHDLTSWLVATADDQLEAIVKSALDSWIQGLPPSASAPPLRPLESEMYRVLSEATNEWSEHTLSSSSLAALTVLAYHNASILG